MLEMEGFWQKIETQLGKKMQIMGNMHHCVLWTGCTDKNGYGVKRVLWPNGITTFERAHRVAYMADHQVTRFNIARIDIDGHQLDVSHVCHNKLCMNAAHLCLERHSVNKERDHCKCIGRCTGGHYPLCLL